MPLVTLFRPVGLIEMRLIFESGMKAFPARLPEQPIFYPVTTDGYAAQIAQDWNTTASDGACGYVLAFDLPQAFVERFEKKVVGASEHEELWVPAAILPDLNARIEGPIRVCQSFFGRRVSSI